MGNVDKRFALLDRVTGDELFPYMKRQKSTDRFGFALTRPGEQDRNGGGHYTTDISEVIRRVVIEGWSVRAKTANRIGRQRDGTLGIGKTANADYWVAPEFADLVRTASTQPRAMLASTKSLPEDSSATSHAAAANASRDNPTDLASDEDIDAVANAKYALEDVQQRAIKTRRGQPVFRKQLFAAYGNKCAVTGCAVSSVLEAAHIIPHAEGTDWDISNGVPLRADIHTLFDLRLLVIGPNYLIHTSKCLEGSEYEKLSGHKIRLPRNPKQYPSPEKLAKQFEGFQDRFFGE
jgi:hypothetical protein